MKRISLSIVALLFVIMESGCSSLAPQYSASMENVQKLKDAGNVTAKVAEFKSNESLTKSPDISLRGSSLISPYDKSYTSYLSEAIKQELALAGKLAPGANIEISGILLKNSIDASGISTGYGDIEARFVVKKSGLLRYDKIKLAHSEWESSLAGAIAIPKAKQEYPRLVQKLLAALYADTEFIQALK